MEHFSGKQQNDNCNYPSRRRFIKDVGLIAGGAVLTSMVIASGCDNPKSPGKTTVDNGKPDPSVAWNGNYKAPIQRPELQTIPGCDAKVAMDRLYAREHTWVKLIEDDIAVIGITERFLVYFEGVMFMDLAEVGSEIERGLFFCSIEGKKMNVDAVSPVTGIVVQNNEELINDPDSTVNQNPYINGWMQVVRLTKPEELDELLSPQDYIDYTAKIVS